MHRGLWEERGQRRSTKMKFSVIIPVYNCVDRLHISVESILQQTYGDFELILVNDGSTDNSLNICNEYASKDSRVKVLNQKNAGAGPARNNAIRNAIGDYLVFCDADDFYDNNALEQLSNAIDINNCPDLLIGNYREFKYDLNGKIINGVEKCEPAYYLEDRVAIRKKYINLRKQGLITAPWTKAYRREVVIDYGIVFPDLRRCQDVVFNLNFYEYVNSLCVIEDVLYNYQTPDGDVYLNKFPVNMFDINKEVFTMLCSSLKRWGVFDDETKKYLNACFLKDTSILLRLNYKNNWNLDKAAQYELSKKMLNDTITVNACKTIPSGMMNKIIRLVLKSRSKLLCNCFSYGTLLYQRRQGQN